MKSKKTLFSIHLIEENGYISAVAEACGNSITPFEIGLEIMASLERASIDHPDINLRVEPLAYTETLQ